MDGASLRVLVLGAAAGGGLPQWNCGCANCVEARKPNGHVRPQTQSSVAVSANGETWALLNASPDLRTQLAASPQLLPKDLRHTPITSVVITNGDIDHIAGLLTLREKQRFTLFSTHQIFELIEQNPIFRVLDRSFVDFETIEPGKSFEACEGVMLNLFPVPGKVPLFMEEGNDIRTDLEDGQTVGVEIEVNSKRAYYIPGCAAFHWDLEKRLMGSDLLMFDGTVFHDDEMAKSGTGVKTGGRMGHMAMAGPAGSLECLSSLDVQRKVYVHINNTNPVWDTRSPERKLVEKAGWEIAEDGMEFRL